MAEFHRGDITLRKLRVLLEGLPPDAPTFWRDTGNGGRQPWTLAHMMAWRASWATAALAQAQVETKSGKLFDNFPEFPWSKPVNQSSYGGFGDHTPEEVLDFLDSL